MSMRSFFPSLRPSVVSGLWFDLDVPYDEEAELRELEKQHHDAAWEVSQICSDLPPIGKAPPLIGPETDDEDNNDDSDESDSHDNDEDEDDMEGADNNQQQMAPGVVAAPNNPAGIIGEAVAERMDQ